MRELHREYKAAGKRRKGEILDELERLHYNRSYARRLMRQGHRTARRTRRRVVRVYGAPEQALLRHMWLVSDCLCGKRLAPMLAEYVRRCVAHGEVTTAPEVCAKVSGMSAATIDRLLAPARARMVGRSRARTKPGTLLRNQVPVRTHRELEGLCAGSVAVDCVGHDGGNGSGEFCQTVVMTDIVTGWTELRAVRNKAHVWVFAALKELCRRFPYPIRAIHSDNGGEFINHHLIAYCRAHGLRFTRSRAARKNDNCHVEQKNWSVARRAIGYGRYVGVAATAALNRVYDVLRLHVNFWQPSHHLRAKWREGSKLCKRYGRAITPCQLTLNLAEIPPAAKVALQACFAPQNPAALKRAITRRQAALRHYNQHTFIADASPELVAARLHSASASHPKRRFACA